MNKSKSIQVDLPPLNVFIFRGKKEGLPLRWCIGFDNDFNYNPTDLINQLTISDRILQPVYDPICWHNNSNRKTYSFVIVLGNKDDLFNKKIRIFEQTIKNITNREINIQYEE